MVQRGRTFYTKSLPAAHDGAQAHLKLERLPTAQPSA